jgi:probable rRNA maturation factor
MTDDPGSISGRRIDVRIDLACPSEAWRTTCPAALRIAREAAKRAIEAAYDGEGACEVSLVLGDDALLRRLNRRYRGLDQPTNVLSFEADELPAALAGTMPRPLGEVIVAYETVARESEAQGKTLAAHLAHLVVHGCLHLLGHAHHAEAEAEVMETLEIAILAGLGYGDPYAPLESRADSPAASPRGRLQDAAIGDTARRS